MSLHRCVWLNGHLHTYCTYILYIHTVHTYCTYTYILYIHTVHTYCTYILYIHVHTVHTYCTKSCDILHVIVTIPSHLLVPPFKPYSLLLLFPAHSFSPRSHSNCHISVPTPILTHPVPFQATSVPLSVTCPRWLCPPLMSWRWRVRGRSASLGPKVAPVSPSTRLALAVSVALKERALRRRGGV